MESLAIRSCRWAVAAALVAATFVPASQALAEPAPSVRLLAADRTVTIERHRKSAWLDLGLWVAATGGDFQLNVTRPGYESWSLAQVDSRTGQTLRVLPAELLQRWRGLKRFLRISFRDSEGQLVAAKWVTFCPNYWERQRVDDQGREVSRYPTSCRGGFPFLRGMVWGIDDHWAAGPRPGKLKIARGRYTVVVRIGKAYRERLAIPGRDARVTLAVRVRDARSRGHGRPIPGPVALNAETEEAPPPAPPGLGTITEPDASTLPDLVALPLWRMRVNSHRGRDTLGFAATPWNAGPAPLVVEGFRRSGEDVMDAYQYFYDAEGNVVGRAPAGTMKFDTRRGHDHWHFQQFASFTLLDASSREVVRSHKQSYCLAPTDAVDLTVPRAAYNPWGFDRGSVCGGPSSIWIREDLDAGWGDTYYQSGAGQAFNITDLANGRYRVRVRVNPRGQLHETTTANNVEERLIRLGGKPGSRRVLVAPWHGIEA